MTILYKDCKVLLLQHSTVYDTWRHVNYLKSEFKDVEMINYVDIGDVPERYLMMSNFKRMPYMNTKAILNTVARFLSHKKCLEYIVSNNLSNVIVLEENVEFIFDDFLNQVIEDKDIIYLGYDESITKRKCPIYRSYGLYYKDYEVAESILDYIENNPHKWTNWDKFMIKEILDYMSHDKKQWMGKIEG